MKRQPLPSPPTSASPCPGDQPQPAWGSCTELGLAPARCHGPGAAGITRGPLSPGFAAGGRLRASGCGRSSTGSEVGLRMRLLLFPCLFPGPFLFFLLLDPAVQTETWAFS